MFNIDWLPKTIQRIFHSSVESKQGDQPSPPEANKDPKKLNRQGYKLMKCGRYDEALDCFHNAFEVCAEDDDELYVQLLFNLSDVKQKSGYLIDSMHYFFKAKGYLKNDNLSLYLMAELIERDIFCDIKESLEAYEKALEWAVQSNNDLMHAKILCKIGFIRIRMHQYDTATSCFSEAIQSGCENAETQAIALRGWGIALNRLNRFDLAEKHLRQAISIDHKLNYLDDLAKDLEELSYALFQANQLKKSAACLIKASLLNQKLADKEQESENYRFLGVVMNAAHEYDKAIHYHQKALKHELEKENKPNIAYLYHQIGSHYHNKDEYVISIKYCVKAAKIYRDHKPESFSGPLRSIIMSLLSLGHSDLALKQAHRALALDMKNTDMQAITVDFCLLGDIMGHMRAWDSAIKYYQNAWDALKKEQDFAGISQILRRIGSAYEAKGFLDKSKQYAVKAKTADSWAQKRYGS
jgi:tetratricopeptide (TPR) repeat protein